MDRKMDGSLFSSMIQWLKMVKDLPHVRGQSFSELQYIPPGDIFAVQHIHENPIRGHRFGGHGVWNRLNRFDFSSRNHGGIFACKEARLNFVTHKTEWILHYYFHRGEHKSRKEKWKYNLESISFLLRMKIFIIRFYVI